MNSSALAPNSEFQFTITLQSSVFWLLLSPSLRRQDKIRCEICRYTLRYCNVLQCTVQHNNMLSCTVIYCILLQGTVLHCTAMYFTELYSTLLYCTVVYSPVLYFSKLLCTAFYCTLHIKLDGVGPVDNRPSIKKLQHFVRKKERKKCDM